MKKKKPCPAGSGFWLGGAGAGIQCLILCAILLGGNRGLSQVERVEPGVSLSAAAERVRKKDYAAALALSQSLLAGTDDPNLRGRLFFLIGYCEFQLKQYEAAVVHFKEASYLYPELSFHGLFYAALSYQNLGDLEAAVRFLEKLCGGHPPGDLKSRALMELLRCHRRRRDAEAAAGVINRLRGMVWLDPAWEKEITFTRGWIKCEGRAYTEARLILVRLWREEPDSFWAGQAESLLLNEPGLYLPGTSSAFSEADRMRRAEVLIKRARPTQAITELTPLVSAAEQDGPPARLSGLLRLRGIAYTEARQYDRALADFLRAQSLLPAEDLELTYLKARCLHRAGRSAEALAVYQYLWESYPRSSYATRALYYGARILKETNDWAGAEAAYRKLLTEYPDSSLVPESMWEIAWLKYLQGDVATAGLALSKIMDKKNDYEFNARALFWKSVILHQLGDHGSAAEEEDRILREFWHGPYAAYLVMVAGRKWPYEERREEEVAVGRPPLEFQIARELYAMGLEPDAEGQLLFLEKQDRLPEWMVVAVCNMYLQLGDYYRSQYVAQRLLKSRLASPPPGDVTAWRLVYPQAFQELVSVYSATYGLDPFLVWSVMRAESLYQPFVRSRAGAIGLMQIMPGTGLQISRQLGEKEYSKTWLYNPAINVKYGCYYLRGRMDDFDGGNSPEGRLWTIVRALAAYNAGPERVVKWNARFQAMGLPVMAFVEEIPFKETREYVKRILGFYLIYRLIWKPAESPELVIPQPAAVPPPAPLLEPVPPSAPQSGITAEPELPPPTDK